VPQTLDELTHDIGRLVDGPAAAECWDRTLKGQTAAFTRRIYSLQGLQTFEALRRRYRGEPAFREQVDHYISEFDKMLKQVGAGEQGQVLTRTYLTSDTGKVYTLLAHAAGRFD